MKSYFEYLKNDFLKKWGWFLFIKNINTSHNKYVLSGYAEAYMYYNYMVDTKLEIHPTFGICDANLCRIKENNWKWVNSKIV